VQPGLAVVLRHILIGCRRTFVEFKQDHDCIYTVGAAPAAGGAAAPAAGC
jgi:hypothetical protein